jgi:hypothetical protein
MNERLLLHLEGLPAAQRFSRPYLKTLGFQVLGLSHSGRDGMYRMIFVIHLGFHSCRHNVLIRVSCIFPLLY